jgi:hypothetical protein
MTVLEFPQEKADSARIEENKRRITEILNTKKMLKSGRPAEEYIFTGKDHKHFDRARILSSISSRVYTLKDIIFLRQQIETYCLPVIDEMQEASRRANEEVLSVKKDGTLFFDRHRSGVDDAV